MRKVNLGEIRVRADHRPIVLFTLERVPVVVHYCEEPVIRGYVRCNGDDCVLCKVGKERKQQGLLPVYDPVTESIGFLSVNSSLRPNALLPQLIDRFDEEVPKVIFISREDYKYVVEPSDEKYISSTYSQVRESSSSSRKQTRTDRLISAQFIHTEAMTC